MPLTWNDIVATAILTVRRPRDGARVVMGWPVTLREGWTLLVVMAILSAIMAEVFVALVPSEPDPAMAAVLSSPVGFAVLQFVGLVILSTTLYLAGKRFGGTGRYDQAVVLVGWLQALLLLLQLAQIVALVLLPPLALLIGVGSLIFALWMMTSFAAELHGFKSLFLTFLGMIGAFVVLVVGLSVVLFFLISLGFLNV